MCSGSAVTSETRFLPADQPDAEWKVILPRVNAVEYEVRHRGDHFFIEIRDDERPNSEVLVASVSDLNKTQVVLRLSANFLPCDFNILEICKCPSVQADL